MIILISGFFVASAVSFETPRKFQQKKILSYEDYKFASTHQ